MKHLLIAAAIAASGSLLALPSAAATLQVYPVNIGFCAGETAQAVYVKNTGSAPMPGISKITKKCSARPGILRSARR